MTTKAITDKTLKYDPHKELKGYTPEGYINLLKASFEGS